MGIRALRFSNLFSTGLALFLVGACCLNGQVGGGVSCATNISVTPTVRAEGYAERIGDVILVCTGGTPTADGVPVPTVNFQIFLNTSVTSRLFTDTWSEALLVVDEPGSGLPGTNNPQLACNDPSGVCTITGTGTGAGTYNGATGRPNVFQGRVTGNSVIFQGIPVDPPPAAPALPRLFRFTNIRANASALYGGPAAGATPIIAAISISGATGILLSNPTPTVAFVQSGETFTVRTPDNQALSSGFSTGRCGQSTGERIGTLRFTEQYGTAFATRTSAGFVDNDTSPAPMAQNVPGLIYNSESGFYNPTMNAPTGDYGLIGLASYGTRLRAVISNIPSGSAVYVSTNRVDFVNGNPVSATTGIVARLIQNESISFAPLTATGTLDGIPVVQLPVSNGTATAVWEVLRANPMAIESADFPVWVLPGSASPNGTAVVNGSFAPAPPAFLASAGAAASASLPVPRFVADTQAAVSLFTVGACAVTFTTPASLPDGIVGVQYNQQLAAAGGIPPLTFSLISGALPTGLNLGSTGAFSGAPQVVGDYSFTVLAADSSGHNAARTFTIRVWAVAPPALSITKSHTGNFAQGQASASYSITVRNAPSTDATRGTVTVSEIVPAGLTLLSMSGTDWNCSSNTCSRLGSLLPGASYPVITVTVSVAADAGSPLLNQVSVSGGGSATAVASDSTIIDPRSASSGLRFVPVTPCRVADTRNTNGPFGGPALIANASRSFAIPASSCNIPSTALAYSLNVTVVPQGPLYYITLWPTDQPQPLASTLNSMDGRVKANAAIVPAGSNGAVSVFATNATDFVMDINGYFVAASSPTAGGFYPLPPCRILDTRNPAGALGGPVLAGGATRHIPVASGSCGSLSGATAYSLNFTVVPRGMLGYLSTWPTGQPQPLVSTLNALTGAVTANAAIVPAGTSGSIDVFVTDTTDLVIDINGYFAPAVSGALSLYTMNPCRVLDTRNASGPLGGPILSGSRAIPVSSSNCGIPASAQAVSLNATVVPGTTLGYLTLWPSGIGQPVVSTLNALDGSITANAALVPLGSAAQAGSLSAYATDQTHLILDVNGYFAQ